MKVEGLDRIDKATARVRENVAKELRIGLAASALMVEKEAKKSILSGGKTGRIYKRGSVVHQASAPGEAPASDTGRLVNNIYSRLNTIKGDEAFIWVSKAAVKYATLLEFGTTKMAARPFFFPAFERSKARIIERLNRAVRKAAIDSVKK